ncbi:MAG: metal ABC transporter ATP-binding protein [Acidimicrobiales bacterium]
MTLVRLDQVTCGYRGRPALVDVTCEVRAGQFLGVVGPSGSGKTTLLRTMTGTHRPDVGTVWRKPRLRVAYVPQVETINWNFPVTVAECVLMARADGRLWPWASRSERAHVTAVLDRLGLAGVERRHIRELSGGQQQRMFIARALVRDAELLVLDEPTSGVDMATRHEMLHLLAELHAEGLAVVVTTHDLNGIAAHLPEILCLNTRVVAAGPPAEVLTPDVLRRTYGADVEVLDHAGMRVVVDRPHPAGHKVVELRNRKRA